MSRHTDRTALAARMADVIFRHVSDLRFQWTTDAAQAAAYRILAEPEIAAGLRAVPILAALEELHQKRQWEGSSVVVCDHCQRSWKCDTRRILDGELEAAS